MSLMNDFACIYFTTMMKYILHALELCFCMLNNDDIVFFQNKYSFSFIALEKCV